MFSKKKKILLFSFALAGLFFLATSDFVNAASFAEDLNQQTGAFAGNRGADFGIAEDPRLVAAQIIRRLLGFIGILFIGYTVYAGYLILTSGGDEQKVEKGKKTLRTAVIGVLVAASAYSILIFVDRTVRRSVGEPEEGFFHYSDTEEYNPCANGNFSDPAVCNR